MPVYTQRVLGRTKASGSPAADTYTVPTGHRFIARCFTAKVVTSGDAALLGLGTGMYLVILKAAAAIVTLQWEGRIAFNAGEDLVVHLDSGEIAYQVTGYLFAA